MEYKNNCLICGEEVSYLNESMEMVCLYCKNKFTANIVCKNNHYVCDNCHSSPSNEVITKYCMAVDNANPIEIAQNLMKHPSIKMHGPEHHFMVPAILLASYHNAIGDKVDLAERLAEAQKRAKNVLGGFCGYYGSCGAAMGVGIFISIVTGATPLSKEEWKITNLATAETLKEIALNGGPRCCKRNTFLALSTAPLFVSKYLRVNMASANHIKCDYFSMNRECISVECKFF